MPFPFVCFVTIINQGKFNSKNKIFYLGHHTCEIIVLSPQQDIVVKFKISHKKSWNWIVLCFKFCNVSLTFFASNNYYFWWTNGQFWLFHLNQVNCWPEEKGKNREKNPLTKKYNIGLFTISKIMKNRLTRTLHVLL